MLTTKMNTYVFFKCLKGSSSHLSVAMVTLGEKNSSHTEIVFCDKGFKITFAIYPLTFAPVHLKDEERISALQRKENPFSFFLEKP